MLPNINVVSFMKKMVKNPDTGQLDTGTMTGSKLTRFKQSLTTGLQQVNDSVAKFSPKSIHVGMGDITGRRLSGKEPFNGDGASSSSCKETSDVTRPPSTQLDQVVSGPISKPCPGPPNRLTTCRVCVRSLSAGNTDVSYRLCSQCNLKVCEDCASYSNLDSDIDQNFWRCSVCRRKSQGTVPTSAPTATTTSTAVAIATRSKAGASVIAHRWSEEKPSSLSMATEDYNKRTREDPLSGNLPPGSVPVARRERRSAADEYLIVRGDLTHLMTVEQQQTRHSNHGRSVEDFRGLNGSVRQASRSASRLDQPPPLASANPRVLSSTSISASESSPDEVIDQHQYHQQRPSQPRGPRRSVAGDGSFSGSVSPSHYNSASRRSFQHQPRDQSLYLSADDACLSRWQPRRYSSESSDASDISASNSSLQRRSQDDVEEAAVGGSSTSLLPSTRRRMSFRSSRTRHFYDADGSDGYDADEQSASAGTFDSSPSPVSTEAFGASASLLMDAGGVRLSSPRRSCSDIPHINSSNDLTCSAATAAVAVGRHSPRNSIYEGDGRCSPQPGHKLFSSQLSDPPPSISRSHSPRSSIASRGSVERRPEAIRIIIDDVDCSSPHQLDGEECSAAPSSASPSLFVAHLRRDPTRRSSQNFTAGFGLTLSGKKAAVITRIEPHGPAERSGLRCGDVVLSWDGIQLVGRSFEDFQNELQHSGDSIQIQVERGRQLDDGTPIELEGNAIGIQPLRPNKLGTNFTALEGNSTGRATPPSPSRRRLPQAPVAVTPSASSGPEAAPSFLVIYRLQVKIKSTVERNGNSCLVIAVISAEKSSALQPHHEGDRSPVANRQQSSDEDSFVWIQVGLNPPNGGARKFVTDRIEAMYGLRWNSVFTCSDLTADEAARSQLTFTLFEDSFQRGKIKLAETKLDLDRLVLDGRVVWFPLRQCDYSSSPSHSPVPPRRLNKAVSHDHHYQQQQFGYYGSSSRNSSELSIDHTSSIPTPSTPPGTSLPRSRSAEMCNLLLQPADEWTAGLSAPASLAASRRSSSHNCEEALAAPRSSPSSRRGSSVSIEPAQVAGSTNMKLVQERLSSPSSMSQQQTSHKRHGQSFRTSPTHNQYQDGHHDASANRALNLELGVGQILPTAMRMRRGGENAASSHHAASLGAIKLGLIITQGQLEVEVIAARNLPMIGENNSVPPDTFVKVSLCDDERVFSKRKTKTMRQTCHPQFHQTLFFDACNALGARLIVVVRLKDGIVSGRYIRKVSSSASARSLQNNPSTVGAVHIELDQLPLTTLTISWYRLMPINSIDPNDQIQSDDSP